MKNNEDFHFVQEKKNSVVDVNDFMKMEQR